jgi:hypothetical protein
VKINRTFCLDVDVARELKKRSNQSYLVNQLLKKHLFDSDQTKSQQTLEEANYYDLIFAAWMKAEPQSFESKMLHQMKRPTSSNPDVNP